MIMQGSMYTLGMWNQFVMFETVADMGWRPLPFGKLTFSMKHGLFGLLIFLW